MGSDIEFAGAVAVVIAGCLGIVSIVGYIYLTLTSRISRNRSKSAFESEHPSQWKESPFCGFIFFTSTRTVRRG